MHEEGKWPPLGYGDFLLNAIPSGISFLNAAVSLYIHRRLKRDNNQP
jgi:hypothetical protein